MDDAPASSAQSTMPRAPRRELRERAADVVEIRVDVEVVGLDVGDRRDGRREREKGAVVLVRLDDEQLVAAAAQVPSPRGDAPADDPGGIATRGGERLGRHHGRRRLAVRARDADVCPASTAPASASARRMTGMPSSRARASSG